MPICESKKVKKTKLCTGDMNDKVKLSNRVIGEPALGSINPSTTFTTLLEPWAIIETIDMSGSSARRFDGINIEDMPTHKVSIFYDSTIWPLDSDNVFVEFNSRRFRIVGVTDLNELKTTIQILCTERGVNSLEASKA